MANNYNSDKYKLYKNNTLILGQEQDRREGGFDKTQNLIGRIKEFRVYKESCTDEKIKELYDSQK